MILASPLCPIYIPVGHILPVFPFIRFFSIRHSVALVLTIRTKGKVGAFGPEGQGAGIYLDPVSRRRI